MRHHDKLAVEIADRVQEVVRKHQHEKKGVALHEPLFAGNEWSYVKECLDTGWVSSVGKYVDRFEEELAAYTGVKRAIAVMNGTAALHMCLLLAGVQRDDEVIVPALTFVATANAVAYIGAVPHFADCEEQTLGIDPDKLEQHLRQVGELRSSGLYNRKTGRRIKAIVVMHTFGHPSQMDRLLEVAKHFSLTLIEDAAESLGSYYQGKHTGNVGLLSAMSFNGNKVMTTGGGGAILTNDEDIGKRAKHLTTTAKMAHAWEFSHDEIGYNYRMPNLNAALGCAQLEQLPSFLSRKRQLASYYEQAFASVTGVRFLKEPASSRSNYWLNAIILDEPDIHLRNEILQETNDRGLMTRPAWQLMHEQEMYKNCPRMELNVAEKVVRSLINLPSSVILGGNGS